MPGTTAAAVKNIKFDAKEWSENSFGIRKQ
jgi:hypothetical protein